MAAAGQKTGKSKANKEGEKKPLSGYMMFGKDFREKLTKSGKETNAKDIMKMIGEAWGKLNESGKEKWNKIASNDKNKVVAKPAPTKAAPAPAVKGKAAAKKQESEPEEEGDEEAE